MSGRNIRTAALSLFGGMASGLEKGLDRQYAQAHDRAKMEAEHARWQESIKQAQADRVEGGRRFDATQAQSAEQAEAGRAQARELHGASLDQQRELAEAAASQSRMFHQDDIERQGAITKSKESDRWARLYNEAAKQAMDSFAGPEEREAAALRRDILARKLGIGGQSQPQPQPQLPPAETAQPQSEPNILSRRFGEMKQFYGGLLGDREGS